MIPRYTRPEMAAIWEPQTRFKIWFEIEAHAADAQAELGVIPKEAAKTVWAKARNATFDVGRIDEIERETRHDVIAFLTHLAEPVAFGLKLAYAYAEFSRARERLLAARKEVATCAISGAVGTFAQIDPRVEA